ncbi:MAG: amino acid ABC transporter substrate-binding protein, partial [Microcystaceae cyanobacterium]
PNTIFGQVIKLVQPQAILVPVQTVEEAFSALDEGKIDAIAGDDIVLEGIRQTLKNPEAYEVGPKEPYDRYGVACMVPEENSEFLDVANYAIVKLMQGYVVGETRYVELLDRWFGPQGIVEIDPTILRDFFKDIIITREQIPPSNPNK